MSIALLARASLTGLAISLAAGTAMADEPRLYLRGLVGYDWSLDANFEDADCSSTAPAALFGCGAGEDGDTLGAYGDFGASPLFEVAAGLEVTGYLRLEAAFDYRSGLEFDGNANFLRSGSDQPVSGDVTQWGLMGFAYLEPLAALGIASPLKPFLGLGAGFSQNEISQMRYDFPDLRQPAHSETQGGTTTNFAWAATAGVGYDVTDHLTLELAYRYSDLGEVETDAGTLHNERYSARQQRPIQFDIPIGETKANLTTQGVSVSARWRF